MEVRGDEQPLNFAKQITDKTTPEQFGGLLDIMLAQEPKLAELLTDHFPVQGTEQTTQKRYLTALIRGLANFYRSQPRPADAIEIRTYTNSPIELSHRSFQDQSQIDDELLLACVRSGMLADSADGTYIMDQELAQNIFNAATFKPT